MNEFQHNVNKLVSECQTILSFNAETDDGGGGTTNRGQIIRTQLQSNHHHQQTNILKRLLN